MSLKRRIIMNAASNWANMLVTAGVTVIVVPVILARLGATAYGVWALLAYGLAFPALLEISFGLAINRFAAFYRQDIPRLNAFVSASFVILASLSAVIFIIGFVVSFFLTDWFEAIPSEYARVAQITCILVGATFSLQMLQSTHAGALRGFEYYTWSNAVLMGSSVLRTILIVVFLMFWKSIIAVQTAYVIATALSAIAMFLVAKRSIPGLAFNFRSIDKATVWELWRYTYHSIARSGSTICMFNALTLLVGWKGSATDVATYDIASKLPNVLRSLLGGMQNVFLPVVTNLKATGQMDMVRTVVKKTTYMCFVLTFIVAILLLALGEPLFRFWLRGDVSPELVMVMNVLVFSMMPDGFFGLWLPVLVGLGDLRWLTGMSIGGAAAAITMTFFLVKGSMVNIALAPAIALLVVLWLYRGIWLPLYGIHQTGISFSEYFREAMITPTFAAGIAAVAMWLLSGFLASERVHFMIRGSIAGIVVLAVFTAIALRQEAKDALGKAGAILRRGKETAK